MMTIFYFILIIVAVVIYFAPVYIIVTNIFKPCRVIELQKEWFTVYKEWDEELTLNGFSSKASELRLKLDAINKEIGECEL